jgi:hypothetical protein
VWLLALLLVSFKLQFLDQLPKWLSSSAPARLSGMNGWLCITQRQSPTPRLRHLPRLPDPTRTPHFNTNMRRILTAAFLIALSVSGALANIRVSVDVTSDKPRLANDIESSLRQALSVVPDVDVVSSKPDIMIRAVALPFTYGAAFATIYTKALDNAYLGCDLNTFTTLNQIEEATKNIVTSLNKQVFQPIRDGKEAKVTQTNN